MNALLSDYYFKVASSAYELEKAFQLRYQVYCQEKKWLNSDDYPDGMEMDDYDSKAIHVVAMNQDFELVGYLRIIPNSEVDTLPCASHPALAGKSLNYSGLAELSRFIIKPDRNSLKIAINLLKVVWQTSMKMGLENWMIICEPSLIRLIVKFKYYFEAVTPPVLYYGGFTQAAILNAQETLRKWEQQDRDAWDFYHKEIAPIERHNIRDRVNTA